MTKTIHIIGAGMAGSEAAWQAVKLGVPVILHEMRGVPGVKTDAHNTDGLAELVCSNSFRSDDAENNAVGLLHWEMRRCGSLIMGLADRHIQTRQFTGIRLARCCRLPAHGAVQGRDRSVEVLGCQRGLVDRDLEPLQGSEVAVGCSRQGLGRGFEVAVSGG